MQDLKCTRRVKRLALGVTALGTLAFGAAAGPAMAAAPQVSAQAQPTVSSAVAPSAKTIGYQDADINSNCGKHSCTTVYDPHALTTYTYNDDAPSFAIVNTTNATVEVNNGAKAWQVVSGEALYVMTPVVGTYQFGIAGSRSVLTVKVIK
jgi:hypothetical protein